MAEPQCQHERIITWRIEETNEPAGLWSCAACNRKFVPLVPAADGLEPWQALYALDNIVNYMTQPNEHPYPSGAADVIRTFIRQASPGVALPQPQQEKPHG